MCMPYFRFFFVPIYVKFSQFPNFSNFEAFAFIVDSAMCSILTGISWNPFHVRSILTCFKDLHAQMAAISIYFVKFPFHITSLVHFFSEHTNFSHHHPLWASRSGMDLSPSYFLNPLMLPLLWTYELFGVHTSGLMETAAHLTNYFPLHYTKHRYNDTSLIWMRNATASNQHQMVYTWRKWERLSRICKKRNSVNVIVVLKAKCIYYITLTA